MIEYIRTIQNERKLLTRSLRVTTDLVGAISVVFGISLYMNVYDWLLESSHAAMVLNLFEFSMFAFILAYLIGFVVFVYLGQFQVLGLFSLYMLFRRKLTIQEGIRYTFFYRVPRKWLSQDT